MHHKVRCNCLLALSNTGESAPSASPLPFYVAAGEPLGAMLFGFMDCSGS